MQPHDASRALRMMNSAGTNGTHIGEDYVTRFEAESVLGLHEDLSDFNDDGTVRGAPPHPFDAAPSAPAKAA